MKPPPPFLAAALLLAPLLPSPSVRAQSTAERPIWISPQTRIMMPPIHHPAQEMVRVASVDAKVEIAGQSATTSLDIAVQNPSSRPQESVMVVPVPDGAVLKSFSYDGLKEDGSARLLPRDEARRIYDSIVAQTRDPALLEFVGHALVRSSVFPVPANGSQHVRVTYEQVLSADGARLDYVLPRSEAVDNAVPWNISVRIKQDTRIASVYSPSHELTTKPTGEHEFSASSRTNNPGPFQLSILREQKEGMTASLIAYPDPKVGGGYFLLMLAPPKPQADAEPMKREVTLVLDRSGSMAGVKLEQARAASLQVLEGLADGEAFNVIVYNESVEMFSPQPVVKNAATMKQARQYISTLRVSGGTNIHDALVEALRQHPSEGMLPIVLFLTDGIPTIGQTSEKAIREVVAKGNPHHRRIFTFGVGVDVNTPLLSRVARETRAEAEFVLPKEDVEVKVGHVFRRLNGPLLASPEIRATDKDGTAVPARVTDFLPSSLPDVFEGEQILLSGVYHGEEPLHFELTGHVPGGARKFAFEFALDKASTANAFVSRLWANNKIAVLSEAIRDLGADSGLSTSSPPPQNDPRFRELVDEIVRLSTQFGILTEYTAFLADDGTRLARVTENAGRAADNFKARAMETRSGNGSVNQSWNLQKNATEKILNARNGYLDADLKSVEITKVQQVKDGAFFQRGNVWCDAPVDGSTHKPDRSVSIGSEDFNKLVDELAADHRQSVLCLRGEILLQHRGQLVLIR